MVEMFNNDGYCLLDLKPTTELQCGDGCDNCKLYKNYLQDQQNDNKLED